MLVSGSATTSLLPQRWILLKPKFWILFWWLKNSTEHNTANANIFPSAQHQWSTYQWASAGLAKTKPWIKVPPLQRGKLLKKLMQNKSKMITSRNPLKPDQSLKWEVPSTPSPTLGDKTFQLPREALKPSPRSLWNAGNTRHPYQWPISDSLMSHLMRIHHQTINWMIGSSNMLPYHQNIHFVPKSQECIQKQSKVCL